LNSLENQAEINYLNKVLAEIELQTIQELGTLQELRQELKESLAFYWEEQGDDHTIEAQLSSQLDSKRQLSAFAHQRHARYHKLAISPYFGRIDFLENSPFQSTNPEIIYFGISSLQEKSTGQFLIYDWRSQIGSMFYDFEKGTAHYLCPAGKITGEITLKRQYKISDGKMVYWFNAELKIDDEMLQQILSQNTDLKMRQIVNSIQKDQNQAIRDESLQLLIVTGPAGSGKTSVALHRAAYLLYRHQKQLSSHNILIFSPNWIFSDYIRNVLPDLGEENVAQTTFADFLTREQKNFRLQFETKDTQLESLFQTIDDHNYQNHTLSISYKASPEFLLLLETYLEHLQETWHENFREIYFAEHLIISQQEYSQLFHESLSYLPLAKRLTQIYKLIMKRIRPHLYKIRQTKELEIANRGEEVNEKTIRALARLQAWSEIQPLIKNIHSFTSANSTILYQRLFEDEALLQTLAMKTEFPEAWRKIREQTLAFINNGIISHEDTFPLAYFHGKLTGFSTQSRIKQIIIDEAQDYTIFHYQILKQLFPKAAWTILGDPEQRLGLNLQRSGLAETVAILNPKNMALIELKQSYRSTYEIQSFTGSILQKEEPPQISRNGLKPALIQLDSKTSEAFLLKELLKIIKQDSYQSIAIICKTTNQAISLYQKIHSLNEDITLVKSDDTEFLHGIVIIPLILVKGLEYDAVIVWDVSSNNYSRDEDRHLLYIACTRALHQLILCSLGTLSPLLAKLDQNFIFSTYPEGYHHSQSNC